MSEAPFPAAAASTVMATARLSGVLLVVVDDEQDTRELLQLIFEEEGATVTLCSSAAAARDSFTRNVPHVLVSDIGMPLEDGYALIRSIRALSADKGGTVRAVALTAYTRAEDRERAVAAGFDEHVAKPIECEVLLTVVERLASRP